MSFNAVLIPCFIAVAHFIGDFPLQSAWMATGKSKSLKPLLTHIVVYTLSVYAVLWWMLFGAAIWGANVQFNLPSLFAYACLNGAAHFVVDFITSKLTAWAHANTKTRLFFVIIGADQLLHGLILLLTLPIFLG